VWQLDTIIKPKSSDVGECYRSAQPNKQAEVIFSLGDVPDLTADPTLAQQELGFSAPQDLATMCRDLWNWQTKNPNGYEGANV
jgi:hypothetical protein